MTDDSRMPTKIKIDLSKTLRSGAPVIVELGCGPNKKEGRVGIDQLDLPGVDIVADLNQGLSFLPDGSVDEIHSKSLLEHVNDLGFIVREIARVLKPGGKKYLFVPHFSNPYYYSDYTHTRFMGLYTFYYFVDEKYQLRRKVPVFYSDVRIRVESVKMIFQSPFRLIHYAKKLFQKLVNLSSWTQEFYEENLCYFIPCYGLEVVFRAAPEDVARKPGHPSKD